MSLSALPVHGPVGTARRLGTEPGLEGLGTKSVEPGLTLNALLSWGVELGGEKLARTGLSTGGGTMGHRSCLVRVRGQ